MAFGGQDAEDCEGKGDDRAEREGEPEGDAGVDTGPEPIVAVVATGGTAAVPNIPGLRQAPYLTNATVFNLTELPARLGVIGAGFGLYLMQLKFGLGITGMSRDVSWGFYIANFTYLVGVAAGGVMVVLPYYLHQLDRVQGAAHFEVDNERARELESGLRATLPGYLVPKLVQEIAGKQAKTAIFSI